MARFNLFLRKVNKGKQPLYFRYSFKVGDKFDSKVFFTQITVDPEVFKKTVQGKTVNSIEGKAFKLIYTNLINKESSLNSIVSLINLELNYKFIKDTPEYHNRILDRAFQENLLVDSRKVNGRKINNGELIINKEIVKEASKKEEPKEEHNLMYHYNEYVKLCKSGKIKTADGLKRGIDLSENTIKKRIAHCESLRLFFEETNTPIPTLSEYTNDLIADFREWHIENDKQNTYINKLTQGFCTFFSWAVDTKLTDNTLFKNLKSLPEFKQDENIFTISPYQLRKFIDFNPTDKTEELYRDVFVFSCGVAFRIGDIERLKVGRVTRENDKYVVNYMAGKTLKKVSAPLPKFAVEVYLKYSKGKNANDLLFPMGKNDKWNRQYYNDGLKDIAKHLGFDNVVQKLKMVGSTPVHEEKQLWEVMSSHIGRKTSITTLLMYDVPELEVRLLSGHSMSSKSFYRYVDLANNWKKDKKILKGWDTFYSETDESSEAFIKVG